MATFSAGWDSDFENIPKGSETPQRGDDRIRELKKAVRERVQQEHVFDPGGTLENQGIHKSGSAVGSRDSSDPSTRPNGDSLDTDDEGRIHVDSEVNAVRVYDGSKWTPARTGVAVKSVSANYSMTQDEDIVEVNTSGGNVSIDLPDLASNAGRSFCVLNLGSNTVTVQRLGSDTIGPDGDTSIDLVHDGNFVILYCGVNRFEVIENNRYIKSYSVSADITRVLGLDSSDETGLQEVQTSLTDTTADRLMKVGAFGLGVGDGVGDLPRLTNIDDNTTNTGLYFSDVTDDEGVFPVPTGTVDLSTTTL